MILAQEHTGDEFSSGLLKIVDYVRNFDFPSRSEYFEDLAALGQLEAVVLVLLGVAFLLFGFKYFKIFVIANAAILGGLIGMYVGAQTGKQNMPIALGLAGAVLVGALAYPLLKGAVCLMGAGAGGVLGYGLWRFAAHAVGRSDAVEHAWVGGIAGLILIGMLAWVAFKLAVMIFTSVQGAVMLSSGVLAVLLHFPDLRDSIQPELEGNRVLVYILLGVPAALGFAYQESKEVSKVRKKRKDTEKPPV